MNTSRALRSVLSGLLWMSLANPARATKPTSLFFIGQEATLITSSTGIRIVSDPYRDGTQAYFLDDFPKGLEAEAVTVSHAHGDHNNRGAVGGNPQLLNKTGTYQVGDFKIQGYDVREGAPKGTPSDCSNRIFVFEVDGLKFVHLGDSGLVTDPEVLQAIDHADVVLVSIDNYVIPIPEIMTFMSRIKARTVLPAHWESARQMETFLKTVPADYPVVRVGSQVTLQANMPVQVLVMAPDRLLKE